MAEICARAGMATGSFYAHFDSKADIFAAVMRQINADLRAAMKAASSRRPAHQGAGLVPRLLRPDVQASVDLPDRARGRVRGAGQFREYYEQLVRGYARGVRHAQLSGDVDAHYDPEVIAYMYTGLGNFVGMRWADWTAGGQVPDDVLDDVLEMLRRGLPPAAQPRSR